MKQNYFPLFFLWFLIGLNGANAQPIVEWAKQVGGTGPDEAFSICSDHSKNIYLTGEFRDSADFDPEAGITNLLSNGDYDVFIAKYDSSGGLEWAKGLGGTGEDIPDVIRTDAGGNIYVAGSFRDEIDFDPGADTMYHTSAGSTDGFIEKLDSSGNFIWVICLGSTGSDESTSLFVEASGDFYVTGYFGGTVDFDPGVGVSNITAIGYLDMFVAKYDANGNFLWVKSIGGDLASVKPYEITLDKNGIIYLGGGLSGKADFDTGADTAYRACAGWTDIFVAKYDSLGNYIWAFNLGGIYADWCQSLKVDHAGNIFLTGRFWYTVDFDPDTGVANVTCSGTWDAFIAKYDKDGHYKWAGRLGSGYYDSGSSLELDSVSNLYVVGKFEGLGDFDIGPAWIWMNTTGGGQSEGDAFIVKYDSNGHYQWADHIGGADYDGADASWLDESGDLLVSGEFVGESDFDPGPDTLSLTSFGAKEAFFAKYSQCISYSQHTDSITMCPGPYVLPDGDTINYHGTYASILSNINGCDSLIYSVVMWLPSPYQFETVQICEGDVYVLPDGAIADSTAYYYSVFTAANDCDSVIVTHLIIDSLDTSVTQADNILTANFPSANYQWVDCNNGWQAISGATDQVFTVTINGNYAVIISDSSGCSDTSACYLVIGLQTATVNSVYEVKLFPTPADQTLQIECKNFGDDILISLYTVDGKMVKEIASTNSSIGLSTADLPAGFYILRCENLHSGKPQNMKFAVIHND